MKYVRQSAKIRSDEFQKEYVLQQIEDAARTCYKSEKNKGPGSAERMIKSLIARGHEAMLEHGPILSMRFITDRGITHEIVRHRLFSFAQESTRYVKYGRDGADMEFILPEYFPEDTPLIGRSIHGSDVGSPFWNSLSPEEQLITGMCISCERKYTLGILDLKLQPQQIRDVLTTNVKSEIVVSGNIREWRHFFKLRLEEDAHPRMRLLARQAFELAYGRCDVVFGDLLSLADKL